MQIDEMDAKLLECVMSYDGAIMAELVGCTGFNRTCVSVAVKYLVKAGLLDVDQSRFKTPKRIRITEEGQRILAEFKEKSKSTSGVDADEYIMAMEEEDADYY